MRGIKGFMIGFLSQSYPIKGCPHRLITWRNSGEMTVDYCDCQCWIESKELKFNLG